MLPYFEIVDVVDAVSGVCNDPDDDKLIACAYAAAAEFLVSDDKLLCEVRRHKSVKIVKAAEFLRMLKAG